MKRVIGYVITILSLVLGSCATTPRPEIEKQSPPTPALIPPTDLRAELGDLSATLRWTTNQPEDRIISGYHIYFAAVGENLAAVSQLPYPGDDNPDHAVESYKAGPLIAGSEYRAYVTTVYPGGIETAPTETIRFVARPQGTFQLRESYKGKESGFSFRRRESVATDDLDNDIYLAVIRGGLYLASPGRIDNILRNTSLFPLRTRQPLSKLQVIERPTQPESTFPIAENEVVLALDHSGCYVLLRIENIDRVDRVVTISYIYQTRPNLLRFH